MLVLVHSDVRHVSHGGGGSSFVGHPLGLELE
jgi:hypothetical protein